VNVCECVRDACAGVCSVMSLCVQIHYAHTTYTIYTPPHTTYTTYTHYIHSTTHYIHSTHYVGDSAHVIRHDEAREAGKVVDAAKDGSRNQV
jgi:hypothetical protein